MNRKILSLLCVVGLWTTFATLPAQADNSDDLLKSCQDMLHTKDFNLTTQICSSGISLYPNRTEFYLVRGFAYGNLNQNLAALEDFNKVLASYPQHLDTLFYRGNIYDALGEPEKALSDFSQIIKAEPKAALVLYRRATIYAGQGEFELAKKDIEAMLELQPFDPNGNKSLAQIEDLMEAYTYQGKSLKSPEMYMQEVHFLKQIQLSNNVLGNLSLMKGSPSSYELLSQCISRFPGNYACNKLILSDYENDKIMSKEFEKSQMAYWIEQNLMRIYSTVLKQEPQNSNIYFGRGLKYFYQYKNYPMAINDLSKAIQYTAGAPNFYYNLRGQAYTESKQYDLAIKDFSEAMKLSPKDYEAYKYRSKAYELQKKYDAALTDINKALELATVKGSLLISRARIYRHKQNPDAALADLNEVLKSFPKDTNALSERAALYRQMGKTDLARADEQKIEEIKKQASLNK